jgi:tetratricopeptide (TPR) repeat protein
MQPDDPETAFLKARVYRKLGRPEATRDSLLRAFELGFEKERLEREQWLMMAQLGQLREAEPHLGEMLIDPRGDSREICEAYVNGFFVNHRIGDALGLLETWIRDMPDDTRPYLLRGKISLSAHAYKDAADDLRRVWKRDPSCFEAAYHLADALRQQGDPVAALPFFEKCLSDPELNAKAELGRARCLRMLSQPEQALQVLDHLLESEPAFTEALLERGMLRTELKRFAEAVGDLRAAVERAPVDLEVRYALATALSGAGRAEEAKDEFEFVSAGRSAMSRAQRLVDAVTLDPRNAAARYEVGAIYLRYGLEDKGVEWLKSVLNYVPQHRQALAALADYYTRRAAQDPQYAAWARSFREQAERQPASVDDAPTTNQPDPAANDDSSQDSREQAAEPDGRT